MLSNGLQAAMILINSHSPGLHDLWTENLTAHDFLNPVVAIRWLAITLAYDSSRGGVVFWEEIGSISGS